MQAVAQRP